MAKFNNTLMKKVKEDQAAYEEQEELRKKHKIKNKNVVIVEKSNSLKFVISTLKGLIIVFILIVIAFLLFVALTALCYPEPRYGLQTVYVKGIEELRTYLPNMEGVFNKLIELLKFGLS